MFYTTVICVRSLVRLRTYGTIPKGINITLVVPRQLSIMSVNKHKNNRTNGLRSTPPERRSYYQAKEH